MHKSAVRRTAYAKKGVKRTLGKQLSSAVMAILFATVIAFLFTATAIRFPAAAAEAGKTRLLLPSVPETSPDEETVAIVITAAQKTRAEIEAMLKPYPDLTLRYIFKHALTGFSVKGKPSSLKKLAKTHAVESVSPVHVYRAEQGDNLQIIGADAARGLFDATNKRLTGRGIKIGVIDTGIDYNHPDLRTSYKGGRDLVDGDDDPMETNIEGLKTIHGTHVAGIIGANGSIRGVAPEAAIYAYRALGPGGRGTTEQVLAAIEEAVKDKMDIINLSLGNDVNGPDLPINKAIDKAVEKGIIAVTSSGNSGPGKWTVGSPGTASKGISVGASTPSLKRPLLQIGNTGEKIKIDPLAGAQEWKLDRSYQLHDGGKGKPEHLKGAAGKIVLIERGELPLKEKAQNALHAGAAAVLIYNNTNGPLLANLESPVNLPAAVISRKDGKKLKRLAKTNPPPYIRTIITEEKDRLAPFSSRGPVAASWEIKPDVVAPGVAIRSTVPGGYLALHGTSMAAPHVAGACALIKQAHPDWSPEKIKAALMNTAVPLMKENGRPYHVFEQGAGRIRIREAIETETIAAPGSLHFGKFAKSGPHRKETRFLTIFNEGKDTKKFSFRLPKTEAGFDWQLPLSFSLGPKESKKVAISLTVNPEKLTKKIYDDYLILEAGSRTIRIPYIFVIEEPDYPRIMGFEFAPGDREGVYRYEVYLPGGAEELAIALFDSDSYRFKGFLDQKRNVGRGMLKVELNAEDLPESGSYIAKVAAKKSGKTDELEVPIFIP